jgi:DNA repair protein RecO
MVKREITTRAMVLARHAAGEGSARVTLYTEDLGLVTALATSAREERSKLRAHLVVGTVGMFSLVKGKRDWRVIGAVRTQNIFYTCDRTDQKNSGARIIAMVRQFVHGEGSDPDLYSALIEFFNALPRLTDKDVIVAEYVAALNILAALGYVSPDPVKEYLGANYSAALLAGAAQKKRTLVKAINDGISASGLVS